MNQLNSVIIEGTVTKLTKGSGLMCTVVNFNLVTKRFSKDSNGETHYEDSNIPIVCYDKMAEKLAEMWPDIKGVRVVGRLKEAADHKLYVVAEHIDVKPVLKQEDHQQKDDVLPHF